MKGNLYLVATPIGNLEDITIRAINVLKEVDIIAAEDTRHTLQLLNYLEIKKPLISYHRHNEEVKSNILIEKLEEGKNIALVSDAGTPAISDPGEEIVKEAILKEIEIIPIPGACALINALITSGLSTREFVFYGFLSLNKKIRNKKLEEIKTENKTIILYEAPHKILKTLQDLSTVVGNRQIVIARELTKIHEEFIRGNILEIIEKYKQPKGENIILIEASNDNIKNKKENEMNIEELYKYYEGQGMKKNEIIKKIAKDKELDRNEVYMKFTKK